MKTLIRFFEENVDKFPDNPYLWEKREGELYPTVPNSVFEYYGDAAGYMITTSKILNIKADFTSQVTPQHLVKAGVNFEQTNFEMLNMGFYSVSNIYKDIFDVTPMDFSAYIQDKMEFDRMTLNVGVRFDYFSQESVTPMHHRKKGGLQLFVIIKLFYFLGNFAAGEFFCILK